MALVLLPPSSTVESTGIAAGEIDHGGEGEKRDDKRKEEPLARAHPVKHERKKSGRQGVEHQLRGGNGAEHEAVAFASEQGERDDALRDGYEPVGHAVEDRE